MQGEKHKQTLLTGNAAIANGDHEGFLKYCTEDTEWNFVGEQTLKGKEAVRNWMEETYLEPPVVRVDHLIAEGDFLTAIGEVTVKDSEGEYIKSSYCDVWRFRDGKMAELKAFVIRISS